MAVYQVAFRDDVSVNVVKQFMADYHAGMDGVCITDHGLTVLVDIDDFDLLEDLYGWAIQMTCNMDQKKVRNCETCKYGVKMLGEYFCFSELKPDHINIERQVEHIERIFATGRINCNTWKPRSMEQ